MIKIIKDENKIVRLDTEQDEAIFSLPDEGRTRWTTWYVHLSKGGNKYYYRLFESAWQGEGTVWDVLSKSEIMDDLRAHAHQMESEDLERVQAEFPGIFEETA